MPKNILLTGGTGYIGSHISWILASFGYKVIVIDQLQDHQTVYIPWATLIEDDFANTTRLHQIFSQQPIDAVIHCAAHIDVSQSIKDPRHYYENNLFKTGRLLETMLFHGIKKCIFSSSCAVYGIPQTMTLTEKHPCNPISPYGRTKHMVEQLLADYDHAYDLRYISLRYFNAAGAEPDVNLGEQHQPETHIIPLLLHAMHYKKPFMLYGNDYDTPDGSCIRDFLHVTDIAYAHYLAMIHLEQNNTSDIFNLGTGKGTSIKQLIKTTEQLFHTSIKVITSNRRTGDPDRLIADPAKIYEILHWSPKNSQLHHILTSAYKYMRKLTRRQEMLHPLNYLT